MTAFVTGQVMISATVPLVADCTGPSGPSDRVATIANDAAKGAEGTPAELWIKAFGPGA